jgi:hypothetical protein
MGMRMRTVPVGMRMVKDTSPLASSPDGPLRASVTIELKKACPNSNSSPAVVLPVVKTRS